MPSSHSSIATAKMLTRNTPPGRHGADVSLAVPDPRRSRNGLGRMHADPTILACALGRARAVPVAAKREPTAPNSREVGQPTVPRRSA